MKHTLIITILAITCFNQCIEWRYEDTPLYIYNQSSVVISNYFPLKGMKGVVYPDTTLSILKENIDRPTNPGEIYRSGISNISYERWIASFPNDTVSIYIFNQDTLDTCPWEEIQRDYKILRRYDLSIENIQQLENSNGIPVIPYPPTAAMKDMKMYPPYGQ